jgi:isoleucyl-tRNA synthetase
MAREIVRRIQTMRKSAGFDISDRIVTYYQGGEGVQRIMDGFGDYVRQETLSDKLLAQAPPPEALVEEHKLDGVEVTLGVTRR